MTTRQIREYAHPVLLAATIVLLLAGAFLFWNAASFETYISALLVLAVAALCFEGRRELQARDRKVRNGADSSGSDADAAHMPAPHDAEH